MVGFKQNILSRYSKVFVFLLGGDKMCLILIKLKEVISNKIHRQNGDFIKIFM